VSDESPMAFDSYNTLYLRAADGRVWKLLPERSGWEKMGYECQARGG
jgi:hypothetical protein